MVQASTQATKAIINQPKSTGNRPAITRQWVRRFAPLASLLLILLFWQWVVASEFYPTFLIPAPVEVWNAFVEALQDGTLARHTSVTLQEMLFGLGIGASLGLLLGYLIAKVPLLEDMLSPIIVAFQATPTLAYAPLLIIWFGTGITSKVIITAIIVFFPMLLNVIVGIRHVPDDLRDLMRSVKATPLQTFRLLEVPSALPVILTGLKTSATLSVIGAVVGEFVGAKAGLGFLLQSAKNAFDTPLVFVTIFTLTALALTLYVLVSLLEKILLAWQRSE